MNNNGMCVKYADYAYNNNIFCILECQSTSFATGNPVECFIYKSNIDVVNTTSALTPLSLYFIDCIVPVAGPNNTLIFDGRIYFHNYDGLDNHYIGTEYGFIQSEKVEVHTPGSLSWKLAPTNSIRTINNPITLSIAKIECLANSQVSMSAWVKKDTRNRHRSKG